MGLDALSWKEFITLGLAVLGAALGILNTWNAINQRRVRLRVKPTHVITMPQGAHMFGIEVVNLSAFPVTISDIGFTLDGRSIDKGRRLSIPQPIIVDGKSWPRRLEAREAVSAYFNPRDVVGSGARIGSAYAGTTCGEVEYGTSPALKQLRAAAVGE